MRNIGNIGLLGCLACLACLDAGPSFASEDLFEAAFGLDYLHDLGLSSLKSNASWPDEAPFPGFPGATPQPAGAVSASLGTAYGNLFRKNGGTAFAHSGFASNAALRLIPATGIDLSSSLEYADRDRSIGDTSLRVDGGGKAWENNSVAAFPFAAALTPLVAVGWRSNAVREPALVGVGLRGRAASGLRYSLSTGRRSLDFPLLVDLSGYKAMDVPFRLRQDFHAASVHAEAGGFAMAWTGRLRIQRRPGPQATAYALSDSGSLAEQRLALAAQGGAAPGGSPTRFDSSGPPGRKPRWRAEAALESASGRHFLRGLSRKGSATYQFGYLEGLQRSMAGNGSLRISSRSLDARLFGGASALDWRAFRPDPPADKQFWDRNGVLDSYEGSLLGIFNNETWLFDGSATLLRYSTGASLSAAWGPSISARGADGREWTSGPRLLGTIALTGQYLDLRTGSNLTRRTSTFLLAYTEEDMQGRFRGLTARLITPELSLRARPLASLPLTLQATASQMIPLSVEMRRDSGKPGPRPRVSASDYSGGTRAALSLAWGLP